MRLEGDRRIRIGRLGRWQFAAGIYIYVGSAWGPGGLAARIGRHLRSDKKSRWHVDYFRRHARITDVWICRDRPNVEHLWAGVFDSLVDAVIPAAKFGSSDCRCPAHLFHLAGAPSVNGFNRILKRYEAQRATCWPGSW